MRNAEASRCWLKWPKFMGRRNQSQKHQASCSSWPSRRKPLSWLPSSWLSSWSPLWLRWSHLLTACFLEPSFFRPRGTNYVISLLFSHSVVARRASASFTVSQNLLKLMSIESMMPSNYLILCHTLLLPSIFTMISESAMHISWPKYWSFSNNLSNEYSGLISFKIG